MRKLPFYVCAAVFAVGSMTTTAYGMTARTCNIPGGKGVVIGGSYGNDWSFGNGNCGSGWSFGSGNCGNGWSFGNGNYGNDWSFGNGNCGNDWFFGDGDKQPVIPDKPDVPDTPDDSDKPVLPDPPGDSNKPDVPDKPGKPDKPDKPDKEEPVQPGDGSSQDAYAAQVVKLVNEERAKAGLSALRLHTAAEGAAMVRAKEIERSFSHTRPDGSDFYTVLKAAGITYQSAGENIAYGQTSPEQVMNAWMNSSGHRANILNGNYTSIAVAHYQSGAGVDYWVQLFLK